MPDIELTQLHRVHLEREGALWVVGIRHPAARNALDRHCNRELDAVFNAFVADSEATVAVITGFGHDFCPGHDYKSEPEGPLSLPSNGIAGLTHRPGNPKPIIAAVNGDAHDEGFEIVLACDLVVAYEHATFSFGQIAAGRRFAGAGDRRLVQRIPYARAFDTIFCGAAISAREGVLLGLVNEIASREQVIEIARNRAAQILSAPRDAVLAAKQAISSALRSA